MNFSQFQSLSERTQKPGKTTTETLNNILLGLQGEFGEILDIIKKHEHHGHGMDKRHLEEEFGDFLFYVAWFMSLYALDGNTILTNNVEKLKRRYPEGFSTTDSINRKE